MHIDTATVKRIAKLARLNIEQDQTKEVEKTLSQILTWVAQLDEIDAGTADPMSSVNLQKMPQREDRVTDGNQAEKVVRNSPEAEFNMFVVPKVVE